MLKKAMITLACIAMAALVVAIVLPGSFAG